MPERLRPAPLGHAVLISNPAAGRGGRRALDEAVRVLETGGVRVDLRETRRRGDAEALAREATRLDPLPDAVVAAGGDGTIHEVVNGLAHTGVPLGVLPLGTANVFARELELPSDPARAARAVLEGRPRRVHLGMAGGRYFLCMAGVGFDAQVVYELDLGLKRVLGKLAYLATGLKVLMAPPRHPFEVEIDGERLTACGAVVGKGHYWGGSLQVTPDARIDEPDLHLCLFTGSRPWDLMRYTSGILRGRHLSYPDVLLRRARRFTLHCPRPLPVQADGDLIGALPMAFSVAEQALTVLGPP
ncbi:MAG: diacylglycerol/lipid kinase family protein [Deferrisomatales bacterium]